MFWCSVSDLETYELLLELFDELNNNKDDQ